MTVYRRYLFIFTLSFSHLVLSVLQDRVIDDQLGDPFSQFMPIYEPPDQWQQGNGCQKCTLRPSPLDAEQGTWHDTSGSSESRSIQFRFTGVSIAIYGIIAENQNDEIHTFDMNWSYTLDNSEPTSYTTPPRTGVPLDSFYYNVSLLSLSNLPNTAHTLVLEASLPALSPEFHRIGAILFDYAKYRFDDGSDSSSVLTTDGSSTAISGSTVATSGTSQTQPATTVSSSNPSGTGTSQADANAKKKHLAVILGLTLGGLAFLSLVFVCIRRHRRDALLHEKQFRVDPFLSTPPQAAAAPLPSAPSIPYSNQLPQTTAMGDGMSPLAGAPSSGNEHDGGEGQPPSYCTVERYHDSNGWSLSRDRKARAAASGSLVPPVS
ncbi:hypothetical protein K435DRAFT_853193 [Dendrothele bispora CBS 962.96]|uniref:Mid2 domain-containing protein n=1 Tax=Dendrothele bispora (strain CBS 962.96) TaxID=1314807 RepID=A0A4S8MHB9_DENBC|nr:hypothetical protein K435DRAFT_853193 [Dendrothele bispora CBS 962.96]